MPILLEDFAGSALRKANGSPTDLWLPYTTGGNPNQSAALDTVAGNYHLTYTGMVSAPYGPYVYFFPQDSVNESHYPANYMQAYIKSGTFDPACNRMSWYVRADKDIAPRADYGNTLQLGTYCRKHGDPDLGNAGAHYYHSYNPRWYANRWRKLYATSKPDFQVSGPTINYPNDPENTVGLVDVLTLTGTFAVANGSPNVVGTGSNLAAQTGAGHWVRFAGDAADVSYRVSSAPDATHMTLLQNYPGTTRSGIAAVDCWPFPSPLAPDTATPGQARTRYWDGMTKFYFDVPYPDVPVANAFNGTNWRFDDFRLDTAANEADDLVSQMTICYTGTQYELMWNEPPTVPTTYAVYHGAVPLKNTDGTYNGAGTPGGADSYAGTGSAQHTWLSPAMAERPTYYFFIQPTGSAVGTQVSIDRQGAAPAAMYLPSWYAQSRRAAPSAPARMYLPSWYAQSRRAAPSAPARMYLPSWYAWGLPFVAPPPPPPPVEPPADLLEALVAYLDGHAGLLSAFGASAADSRSWADEAPAGTPMPYLVLSDITEDSDYESAIDDPAGDTAFDGDTFDGGRFDGAGAQVAPYTDEVEVQVSIFAGRKAQARALRRLVTAALDDAPITFTSGDLFLFRKIGRPMAMKDPELGPDGTDVFMEVVQFRGLIGRTL